MSDFVRAPGSAMIALSRHRDASDDDEDEPRPRAVGAASPPAAAPEPSSAGGSSSHRKPRGRPPGSKNKPKPPVVITKASESAMHPVVLELSGGSDVASGVSDFARRRGVAVSVLGGSGAVADVTLRHPSAHGSGSISVPGRFEILSLSGTILPPPPPAGSSAQAWPAQPPPLTVSLAGPHGQVIGGTVAGPMTAVGPVLLVAATFEKPEFHSLPLAEEEESPTAVNEEIKPGAEAMAADLSEPGPLSHPDVVLWAQPSSSRPSPPGHPPPHY